MSTSHDRTPVKVALLTVLWFGTLWGATEALLGGLLHLALPPTYPGRIMIGVAMALMAYAVRRTGTPWIALGMALVAAPLKLFSAIVFALPIAAPVVINPAFAILAQGLAFTAVVLAFRSVAATNATRYTAAGAVAGGLQALLYAGLVLSIGMWAYPSASVLQELGTKFPVWTATSPGVIGHLGALLPWSVLAGAAGGLVGGLSPVRSRAALRPASLAIGSALCLVIYFAASMRL